VAPVRTPCSSHHNGPRRPDGYPSAAR